MELAARQVAQAQLALLETWIAARPALTAGTAMDAMQAATGALVHALCRPQQAR